MFVRPGERGQGVGKAILLFLEAEAARTGYLVEARDWSQAARSACVI